MSDRRDWPLWEIFIRSQHGLAHKHVGSLHAPDAASLALASPEAAVALLVETRRIAMAEGHDAFRLVFNTGEGAGQTVFHAHGHVLAGRDLTWPPG